MQVNSPPTDGVHFTLLYAGRRPEIYCLIPGPLRSTLAHRDHFILNQLQQYVCVVFLQKIITDAATLLILPQYFLNLQFEVIRIITNARYGISSSHPKAWKERARGSRFRPRPDGSLYSIRPAAFG